MFQLNKEYDRQELLDFIGSKQNQSGIIWGNKEPDCVIITSGGKHGKNAGYEDTIQEDGSWKYIGQGSKGDQLSTTKANSLLANQERNVLLFSTREPTGKERKERGNARKRYRFEGIFDVLSYRFVPGEGIRSGDQLIQFHLVPADNIFDNTSSDEIDVPTTSLEDLRSTIRDYQTGRTRITTPREYKIRSKQVKVYALKRANGICELCNSEAPFKTESGVPFLEVHHIHKLADDGPDLPGNVCGLCPNCHREAHYGVNRQHIKDRLVEIVEKKEALITS